MNEVDQEANFWFSHYSMKILRSLFSCTLKTGDFTKMGRDIIFKAPNKDNVTKVF